MSSETHSIEEEASAVRLVRDQLLETEVDPAPSRFIEWEAKSEEQKTAWKNYRQALLDVTDQEGFPYTIVWPTKP
tara:strand:- start:29 stop:253 length:225 start_codon:yes stop_codon:yes gene_type:complete